MTTDRTHSQGAAFTGRQRARETRRGVLVADRAAGVVITLGGLGTIIAVLLVCVFLVWVVIPLFLPGVLHSRLEVAVSDANESQPPIHASIDEYLNIAWLVTPDGAIRSYRVDTGELLATESVSRERQPTAWSFALRDGHVAFAFDDSTVQLGQIDFGTSFVPEEEVSEELRGLPIGKIASWRDGVLERTPEGQYRLQQLRVELQEPVKTGASSGIAHIDLSVSSRGTMFAALTKTGELRLAQVSHKKNLLTGKVTTRLKEGVLQVELPDGRLPSHLLLAGLGDSVFLVWDDGFVRRFDTRDPTRPVIAEELDLVEEPDVRITSLAFLVGKSSFVSGDSLGRLRVWFRIRPETTDTPDGSLVVKGHELSTGSAEVVALGASPRARMIAAACADGTAHLFHITSEQELAEVKSGQTTVPIQVLAISPKDDAVLGLRGDRVCLWNIDVPHPEITWSSILAPVWYEGYEKPENVWQSSSATDDFEEKYGLLPLIFGTFKATLYSMLFGAPLALLAAIYTSEFLHPRAKSKIKPAIEIMASLPSVVLGFLAALFFAPLVEDIVPECLAAFVTVPFAYLLGAYLWQLLPTTVTLRAGRLRMIAMILALPIGLSLAFPAGRIMENWLFSGNITAWLDGQIGTGTGAWMFVLLPVSVLAVGFFSASTVTPWMRRFAGTWPHLQFALFDLARFLLGCLAVLVLAYVVSASISTMGWDPRGTFVDTYVQRNALVVGFIMGFAIIPIIYTISDDALSSVPESLRAGSLGTGATPWQTASRVVIPTAMSGLFSAMMIGLGRAVGETMIVLMAAGNTPVMDWNIFNGFRTLSANIAVELPEAVKDSTHYRMLFLAALSLFVMTFVVNTVAEVVRLRFRKRAFQL